MLQQAIKAHLTYRYQEQHVALKTLSADLSVVLPFLAWAREHTTLTTYPEWDKERVRDFLLKYFARRNFPFNTGTFHFIHPFTFSQPPPHLNLPHPAHTHPFPAFLPLPH